MGGVIVEQPLPNQDIEQRDPFLLIHHWKQNFPGNQKQNQVGVGPHPHRGFTPVTVIYKGSLHHRDSLGNSSIVNAGGVQWTNSGKGITHSERPSKSLAENGGEFEIIQFWVNTPAKHKLDAPRYFALDKNDIPEIWLDGKNARLQLIAGNYQGHEGPAPVHSPLMVANIYTRSESAVNIKMEKDLDYMIYQLSGRSEINGRKISEKTLVIFGNEGAELQINSLDDSVFLLLGGKAIEEEISSYGPFVMNTTTEILQAIRDAQMGKMGVLIEEFN